jgi:xylulokinase
MLIGIDLGTTGLKAAVYDPESGKCFAQASARLPLETASDGRREQNSDEIISLLERVFATLRKKTGTLWADVKGVGLASQGGSTLIVERKTGRPLSPMYLWNDFRCFPFFARLKQQHPVEFWRSFSKRDEPGFGLGRIQWLREKNPELLTEQNMYIGAGELVFHQLTGIWRQDAGHALQSGCYDIINRSLTQKPLDLVGLNCSFFAPMRDGHSVIPLEKKAAARFGLPAGIPVAGPYNDHEAGYLSVMHLSKRPLQCSLGTAWVGNFVLDNFTQGSGYQLPVPAPAGSGMLIIQALLTGCVTWDWALEQFLNKNHREAIDLAETLFQQELLPPDGLLCMPWLNRPNPLGKGSGAGVFFGMSPATTREDLLRAVALGMVLEFGRVFDPVCNQGVVDSLVLCGGSSQAEYFRKLFATLFAPCPVYIPDGDSMGTRGCLYSINPLVAQAEAYLFENPGIFGAERLGEMKNLYNELYRRLYSGDSAGRSFVID